MKQIWVLPIMLALFGAIGCEKEDDTASAKAMAACGVCGREMAEDTYCVSCNAVATTETDLVHCRVCDEDFRPGTYCAQCNRFMLNATVHCGNCRDQVVKGHYCTTEKLFKGLPDIAYCQEHRRPYDKSLSCPDCENKDTEKQIEG
jgi:uncharacterized lipoprotein NlpE involved in copper resistance